MAFEKPCALGCAEARPDTPTIIEFLLDETGSMSGCAASVVSGFNDFVSEQRATGGKCLLTLTKFDTSGIKTPYIDLSVHMVPTMTHAMFTPGGGTNLYDTIGGRMAALTERLGQWEHKPNVLFVVMTDGGDNASTLPAEAVRSNIVHMTTEHNWSFVYLGAHAHALEVADKLGFAPGNSKQFKATEMRETMQDLAKATKAYRQKGGFHTSDDFFAGK